jgi:hypothetical protein
VEDILKNTQQFFYALKMKTSFPESRIDETATLEKREVNDAAEEPAVKMVAGTYIPDEHRIRDATHIPGYRVLTFAKILKYNLVPLPQILSDVLGLAQEGMGCPVELEFSVNLEQGKDCKPEFVLLQTRPMTARTELMDVDIRDEEISRAFCFSAHALGNGEKNDISDILYVKPDAEPSRTVEIAREIGKMNSELVKEGRKYLLIGPGRWGSADPWLGIPVNWSEISGVGAVVEARSPKFNAEPSQGSHFFHNIITLGIHYVNISEEKGDVLDWERILSLSVAKSLAFVSHVRLDAPITLKADGRKSCCVMYSEDISP